MNAFRYQAIQANGSSIQGTIEAEDRRAALKLLGERGLFPASLEFAPSSNQDAARVPGESPGRAFALTYTSRIRRKDITNFTREMSALLGAAISIPQALDGLGEQEENPA